jgi:hypothetical protein
LPVAEPRNLGLVHVTKNFDTVMEAEWNSPAKRPGNSIIQNNQPVSIKVTRSVVDSNGPSVTFSRTSDPSQTATQTGVVWLTNLPSGVSAERPKLIKVRDGEYIALWEEWSYSGTQLNYRTTKALLVDEQGRILRAETTLSARLNKSGTDRPFVLGSSAAWITGEASTGKFTLYSLDANLTLTATTLGGSAEAPMPAPRPNAKNHLNAGEILAADGALVSDNGRYNARSVSQSAHPKPV